VRRPRRRDAAGLAVAVGAWLAGIVLVAAVGEAVVVQRVDRGAAPTSVPAERVAAPSTVPTFPTSPPPTLLESLAPILGLGPVAEAPAGFDFGVSDPLAAAPGLASLLPSLPVIELPPLPPELLPLLAVVSPTARQVCSTTGVVIVLSALVKGDLETAGIPVTQALTYLGPVLQVCALFPEDEPSICAVDTALNEAIIPVDLRLLVGIPPLAALGLDQAASIEAALRSAGLDLPPFASELVATSLGCMLR